MNAYFELDLCTNCRTNQWKLGHRQKRSGKTEFTCIACGGVVMILTTAEGYEHLVSCS